LRARNNAIIARADALLNKEEQAIIRALSANLQAAQAQLQKKLERASKQFAYISKHGEEAYEQARSAYLRQKKSDRSLEEADLFSEKIGVYERQRAFLIREDLEASLRKIEPLASARTLDDNIARLERAVKAGALDARQMMLLPDAVNVASSAGISLTEAANAQKRMKKYLKNYSEEHRERITNVMTQGLLKGDGVRKIAREMRDQSLMTKSQAERLVRTEYNQAVSDTQKQEFKAAGIDKGIPIATQDRRVCPRCASRAGQIMELNQIINPLHPHCRCRITPIRQEWIDKGLVDTKWYKQHHEDCVAKAEGRVGGSKAPEPQQGRTLSNGIKVDKNGMIEPGQVQAFWLANKDSILEELEAGELRIDALPYDSNASRTTLHDYLKANNPECFDLPTIVDNEDEFVRLTKPDTRGFRGDAGEKYHTQLMEGDYYVGEGIYGDGTYVATPLDPSNPEHVKAAKAVTSIYGSQRYQIGLAKDAIGLLETELDIATKDYATKSALARRMGADYLATSGSDSTVVGEVHKVFLNRGKMVINKNTISLDDFDYRKYIE
jgi:SPP1 gp7 family putative phage head morphogenesis protein